MRKEEETERVKLAKEILEWVLSKDTDFSNVMPEIKVPEKQVNTKFFDANQETEKWVMPYPVNQDILMVRNTRPEKGKNWWSKITAEKLEEHEWVLENEITNGWFDEGPSAEEKLSLILENKDKPIKNWIEAYNFYLIWQDWFRHYADAERYLSFDFDIDYSDCIVMNTENRKEYCQDYNIRPQNLKQHLKEHQMEYIYERKVNKDLCWFIRRKL